jgi:N-6 DNA Methylase/TaqI-like C-terminal specificity domain
MPAPTEVRDLVQRFSDGLATYLSADYDEAKVRIDFINPLFEYLDWDIRNRSAISEDLRDVITEYRRRVGGTVKAPDYCFRIGGENRFFVEAKRPSVKIETDAGPARQLRSYAWSAQLPVSVLTDFEEFAVYVCRVAPEKDDKASVARYAYYKFGDYVDKWDEIAALFSHNAVMNGSLEQFASQKAPRNAVPVDVAFLKEIEGWRATLARNIAQLNDNLSIPSLNYAVQMTLDRIIFLRIAEDRNIEPAGQLLGLTNAGAIYDRLKQIFRQADARYNSGLFHFADEPSREEPDELTLGLKVDDTPLSEIITHLYFPTSPYIFNVIPVEILGQVYEQFLGRIITVSGSGASRKVEVDEKPEVRKAGGVYYTPKYIVDYIVEHTVGRLLRYKNPQSAAKLKILDPACGSGSFLLGAYSYLLDWHLKWYLQHDPQKQKAVFQADRGLWRLTSDEKKRILRNNIFGVDIDPQAVEVTKLSLLLKVLEGETGSSLAQQLTFLHQRALPDLSNNIKCGNSLISSDFNSGQQQLPGINEQLRVNAFDWASSGGFDEIMGAGGFDAVIGNPPYVLIAEDDDKKYLQRHYKRAAVGKPDLYRYFVEKSHELVKNGGWFGFIIPNTILTIPAGRELRMELLTTWGLSQIVNFWGQVFKRVSVNSVIIITQKGSTGPVKIVEDEDLTPTSTTLGLAVSSMRQVDKDEWLHDPDYKIALSSTNQEAALIRKVRAIGVELSSVARYSLGMQVYHNTVHTKEEMEQRISHSTVKKDETYWPESGGSNVQRYHFDTYFDEFVSYGGKSYSKPAWEFFSQPRILIREITGKTLICTFTDTTHISRKAIIVVLPEGINVYYLLGILNSSLIGFYVRSTGEKGEQRLFPRISLTTTRKLPIRTLDMSKPEEKAQHDQMVALVERTLALHKRLAEAHTAPERTPLQRQIEATDKEIDNLVYELYGLTDEERKIVEGSAKG